MWIRTCTFLCPFPFLLYRSQAPFRMSSTYNAAIKELRRDKSQPSLKIGPYTSLLTFLLTLAYFTYRIYGISNINPYNDSSPSTLVAWMYLFAELGIFWPKLLNNLFRVLAIKRGPPAPCLRYVGDQGPRIDIMIVCCGEELYTVFNTVKAACASHYPSRLLRIVLLDDGGSHKLESSILHMKQDQPGLSNLYYYARKKGPNHNYKAGNQNDGCRYAASLPGGPADVIAFLDADMIPEPDWLRALLPHLLENPKIALATLTQVCGSHLRPLEYPNPSFSAFTTSHHTIHYSRVWNFSSRCYRQ